MINYKVHILGVPTEGSACVRWPKYTNEKQLQQEVDWVNGLMVNGV